MVDQDLMMGWQFGLVNLFLVQMDFFWSNSGLCLDEWSFLRLNSYGSYAEANFFFFFFKMLSEKLVFWKL